MKRKASPFEYTVETIEETPPISNVEGWYDEETKAASKETKGEFKRRNPFVMKGLLLTRDDLRSEEVTNFSISLGRRILEHENSYTDSKGNPMSVQKAWEGHWRDHDPTSRRNNWEEPARVELTTFDFLVRKLNSTPHEGIFFLEKIRSFTETFCVQNEVGKPPLDLSKPLRKVAQKRVCRFSLTEGWAVTDTVNWTNAVENGPFHAILFPIQEAFPLGDEDILWESKSEISDMEAKINSNLATAMFKITPLQLQARKEHADKFVFEPLAEILDVLNDAKAPSKTSFRFNALFAKITQRLQHLLSLDQGAQSPGIADIPWAYESAKLERFDRPWEENMHVFLHYIKSGLILQLHHNGFINVIDKDADSEAEITALMQAFRAVDPESKATTNECFMAIDRIYRLVVNAMEVEETAEGPAFVPELRRIFAEEYLPRLLGKWEVTPADVPRLNDVDLDWIREALQPQRSIPRLSPLALELLKTRPVAVFHHHLWRYQGGALRRRILFIPEGISPGWYTGSNVEMDYYDIVDHFREVSRMQNWSYVAPSMVVKSLPKQLWDLHPERKFLSVTRAVGAQGIGLSVSLQRQVQEREVYKKKYGLDVPKLPAEPNTVQIFKRGKGEGNTRIIAERSRGDPYKFGRDLLIKMGSYLGRASLY